MTKARNFLDHLYLSDDEHISVVPKYEKQVKEAFNEYNSAKERNKLLSIPYISVNGMMFFYFLVQNKNLTINLSRLFVYAQRNWIVYATIRKKWISVSCCCCF